jgi:hypothetical protein
MDEIKAHLTPEKADDPGYLIPQKASDWAALTDDELFRLRRELEHASQWPCRLRHDGQARPLLSATPAGVR